MEVPGQKFALVSFIKEGEKIVMNIWGAFPDEESAKRHCTQLMEMNNKFDIFMTSMYNWVPCAPSREQIQEEHFSNQYLEELMNNYEAAQREAQLAFEKRKQELLDQAKKEREEQKAKNEEEAKKETNPEP